MELRLTRVIQALGRRRLAEDQQLQNVEGGLHSRRQDPRRRQALGEGFAREKQPRRLQFSHGAKGRGIGAVATRHGAAPGQVLDQPEPLDFRQLRPLAQQPQRHGQKTAKPMQGHGQLLGQGAGQHHREPGAGEATGPRGHHQSANFGPTLGGE